MATEVAVLVDALPYIDQGYDDPGVREAALSMVDEETRRYRPTKNYLDYLPAMNTSLFETEIMKAEFERLNARLPMEMLSMKRYELPHPPSGKMTDISAWTECVDNSMAQLEHQSTRIANLELMEEYGCESWRQYINILLRMLNQAQKQLQELKKQIQEVNWHRKAAQSSAGEKLQNLEASWVGLVSKNYEIERACAELEKELYVMHKAKESRLNVESNPNVERNPDVETNPNVEADPNCETNPNVEADPNCETNPKVETDSNCETDPDVEMEIQTSAETTTSTED